MSVRDYKGAVSQKLDAKTEKTFNTVDVPKIKSLILAQGYAQEAVDALSFELAQYTLTISDEEYRSGAFHTKANGKPFYALTVNAPGAIYELNIPKDVPYIQLPAQQQAMLLAFEIGMNMFSNMGRYLQVKQPGFNERDAGGSGGPAMTFEKETTFTNVDASTYMSVLTEALGYRLNQLNKEQLKPAEPAARKAPGAPKF